MKDLRNCNLDEILQLRKIEKQLCELRHSDNWSLKEDNRLCDILYKNWGMNQYHPS